LRAEEVVAHLKSGYHPRSNRVVDSIATGHFSRGDKDIFRPLVSNLLSARDEYVHLADFQSYIDAQQAVDVEYRDRASWNRKALLNIARMGKFSSDRTVSEYAREIWQIKPAVIGSFAHAALLEE